jgi:glycerophosphoryl diester phosphodiesterase
MQTVDGGRLKLLAALAPALLFLAIGGAAADPIVIGHRGGATGYLPEHTLENYARGIDLGADFVEPDLESTRDGHLIARHEPNMIATTNVKDLPQFASRRRRVIIDGQQEDGFFACDFTLAEIKTLRAVQPMPERDQSFNGRYEIPTLEEIIALVKRKSVEKGRTIGIYPETKHPAWHRSIGLPLEDRLLDALSRAGWTGRDAPVFVQSFERASLEYVHARSKVRLIQLVGGRGASMLTPEGLDRIREYADGIGPEKSLLDAKIVADAHARGLVVHPWTFRNEAKYVLPAYKGDPVAEYLAFYRMGVDGVFSDFADTAADARKRYLSTTSRTSSPPMILRIEPRSANALFCAAKVPATREEIASKSSFRSSVAMFG